MERNLIYYRNELKNKTVPKYKIMGITSEMILSKEIFRRNTDVIPFLKKVFSIEYKHYVILSRTMIVARTILLVSKSDEHEYKQIKNNLFKVVELMIQEMKKENDSTKNEFNGWLS
ncbi:hypothetical protein V7659_31890 [Neobacillus drentensis]|uniref:hypothetical protein n=1 Tax=Neobacillus drentensis TaxID=220684 RepID=UPI0030005405